MANLHITGYVWSEIEMPNGNRDNMESILSDNRNVRREGITFVQHYVAFDEKMSSASLIPLRVLRPHI